MPFNPLTYWVVLGFAHPSPICVPRAIPALSITPFSTYWWQKKVQFTLTFTAPLKGDLQIKKNQAHLVLCAECPQINRIKWAFSPHVKCRWKDWHWMCTLILCSWNRVLSNALSNSSKLRVPHFCLSLLATARWDGGVAEISLWMVYFCNCNKRAGKARGQQAGPSSPFSLLPLLRHQSLCFLNALTWHWATPCGGTGGSDIFEDEVLKAGTNFSTVTGRDFPCKAMNMIAISHCSHHAGFPSSFCVWPCLTDSPSSDPAQESVSASA